MSIINECKPYWAKLCRTVKIDEVMMKPAISVREDDDFSSVQEKFVKNHLTHVCVTDNHGKFVGLISQKYLYKAQSPRKIIGGDIEYKQDIIVDGDSFYNKEVLDSYILSKIMNRNPFTLKATQTLDEAIKAMSAKHMGCIAIVDGENKLLGVLTDQIIVKYLAGLL